MNVGLAYWLIMCYNTQKYMNQKGCVVYGSKKLSALILASTFLISAIVPPLSAFADIVDTSSVLTKTAVDNTLYSVSYVKVTDGAAHVTYYSSGDCTLLVGAYDILSWQMLCSNTVNAAKAEFGAVVDMKLDTSALPEKFDVKCFMLAADNSPLCDALYFPEVFVEPESYAVGASLERQFVYIRRGLRPSRLF